MMPPPAPSAAPAHAAPPAAGIGRALRALGGAARWLLLPVWIAQVFSGRKSFAGNPLLGSVALNRRGLHVWRLLRAQRLAAQRRARLRHLLTAEERAAFERDGYLMKRDFLAPGDFAALLAEVRAFRGTAIEYLEGRASTRQVPIGLEVLRALPHCRALFASHAWRRLLRYAAGYDTPPGVFIQQVVTDATVTEHDPQTDLHIDTFHPTMKAWLFLTDVAEDGGPFTYVPGSHRATPRRLAWQRRRSVESAGRASPAGAFRIDRRELRRLHLPEPVRFAVPANTLVVGDTFGFHARGASTGSTSRLEIHVISRENPFRRFLGWELQALGLQYVRMSAYRALIALKLALGLRSAVHFTAVSFAADPPAPDRSERMPSEHRT